MKSMHHRNTADVALRRKASKNSSSYKPNPAGLNSCWRREAPSSLPDRFASRYFLHVEAGMVKAGDPVMCFIKSKDLLDEACKQSSPRTALIT